MLDNFKTNENGVTPWGWLLNLWFIFVVLGLRQRANNILSIYLLSSFTILYSFHIHINTYYIPTSPNNKSKGITNILNKVETECRHIS